MAVSGHPAASAVLNRLDWLLDEPGRREHRFAWLTERRSGDWLAVDAYYPQGRVVVIASADIELLEQCEAVVPTHGFYVLALDPSDLEGDPVAVATRLRGRLTAQGWMPRPTEAGGEPAPPPRAAAAGLSRIDGLGPRPAVGAERVRRQAGDPSAGVILVLIVVFEIAVGGGVVGLGAGDYVLGFGFLLDACARVLGTIAASHNGSPDAAWSIVLLGSPVLWSRNEFDGEVAPVAQLTAIVAGIAVGLGIVMAIL